MLKTLLNRATVVAALCMASAGAAHAGSTWYLSGVTFEHGATATGWFEYDTATGVGDYSLSTSASPVTPAFSAFTYVPGNSYLWQALPLNNLAWLTNDGSRFLALTFAAALNDGAGAVAINGGGYSANGSWEHIDGFVNRDTGYNGFASVSAIPEVEAYAMLIAGIGLVGAMARRRKGQAG